MKVSKLILKGGNFAATVSGEVKETKLAALVESGLSFEGERGGWSKTFKGVKVRKSVAFTADAAKVVQAKLSEHLGTFLDSLTVEVTARVWSEGAGGVEQKARASYDASLAQAAQLNLPAEIGKAMALAGARSIMPTFDPDAVQVTESLATPEVASEEQPDEVGS